jgi:hypothetical protein
VKEDETVLREMTGDGSAREIFADDAASISLISGVLRITFTTVREEAGSAPKRVVVSRLAMPLGGAQELCISLTNFLKSKGWNPQ